MGEVYTCVPSVVSAPQVCEAPRVVWAELASNTLKTLLPVSCARVRFQPRQLRNHRPGGEVKFGGGVEVGMARKAERRSSRRPVDGPVEVGANGRLDYPAPQSSR